MLIKALCDYYDALARNGNVLSEGYSNVKIHYLVSLTLDGTIDDIINWQETVQREAAKGKIKEQSVPRTVVLPERTEKPGIEANIVEHRALYIFGLNFDKDIFTPMDRTGKAKKSHEALCEKNLAFLEGLDSPVVNAYRAFLSRWNPEAETENHYLVNLGKAYSTAGFAFCLSGRPDILLHRDQKLLEKWEVYRRVKSAEGEPAVVAQCAITGENAPIARIHSKIKGVYGGLATGSVLIGFNNPSESSYGNDQSYNSNISENAMRRYAEALNYLLSSRKHKVMLDDMTVVFWASDDNDTCNDLMAALLFDNPDSMDGQRTEEMLRNMMKDARNGIVRAEQIADLENIDPNVDFYIIGMKPNSSRLAMKFLYHKRFGEILQNIARHQLDLQMSEDGKPISLWRIGKSLISPKSNNETVDVALMAKILEAVVYGSWYPSALMAAAIRRVKTDSEGTMSYVHAGIIKACINRRKRLQGEKEEITLSLNKENERPAYLCGRLFAVLERLQQEASNNSLNRTIKDAYFASASSKPALIFPKLLRLAQNHLGKVKFPVYYNKMIQEIMDKLPGEFPETLLIQDQGRFMIGYYQQYQSFFATDKSNKEQGEK